LLCSGFHLLLDNLLYYSSGSGFSVFDSGRAARRRSAPVFLRLPLLLFSPLFSLLDGGIEETKGRNPNCLKPCSGASPRALAG
jgi:hypothetical protein